MELEFFSCPGDAFIQEPLWSQVRDLITGRVFVFEGNVVMKRFFCMGA